MKTDGSLLCLHDAANGVYLEPVGSNAHLHIYFLEGININLFTQRFSY
jgi:hypothetical protein